MDVNSIEYNITHYNKDHCNKLYCHDSNMITKLQEKYKYIHSTTTFNFNVLKIDTFDKNNIEKLFDVYSCISKLFTSNAQLDQNYFNKFIDFITLNKTYSIMAQTISSKHYKDLLKLVFSQKVYLNTKQVDKIIRCFAHNMVVEYAIFRNKANKLYDKDYRNFYPIYLLNKKGYIFNKKQREELDRNKVPVEYYSQSVDVNTLIENASSLAINIKIGIPLTLCNFMAFIDTNIKDIENLGHYNLELDQYAYHRSDTIQKETNFEMILKNVSALTELSNRLLNQDQKENCIDNNVLKRTCYLDDGKNSNVLGNYSKYKDYDRFSVTLTLNNIEYISNKYSTSINIIKNSKILNSIINTPHTTGYHANIRNINFNRNDIISTASFIKYLNNVKDIGINTVFIMFNFMRNHTLTIIQIKTVIDILKNKDVTLSIDKVTYIPYKYSNNQILGDRFTLDGFVTKLNNSEKYKKPIKKFCSFYIKIIYIMLQTFYNYSFEQDDFGYGIMYNYKMTSVTYCPPKTNKKKVIDMIIELYISSSCLSFIPKSLIESIFSYNLSVTQNTMLTFSMLGKNNGTTSFQLPIFLTNKYIIWCSDENKMLSRDTIISTNKRINISPKFTIAIINLCKINRLPYYKRLCDFLFNTECLTFSDATSLPLCCSTVNKFYNKIFTNLSLDEIYYVCFLNDTIIYNIIIQVSIPIEVLVLRHICNTETSETILSFMKKFNLNLDNYCAYALYTNNYIVAQEILGSNYIIMNFGNKVPSTIMRYYCNNCRVNHPIKIKVIDKDICFLKRCAINNKFTKDCYNPSTQAIENSIIKSQVKNDYTKMIPISILSQYGLLFGTMNKTHSININNLQNQVDTNDNTY